MNKSDIHGLIAPRQARGRVLGGSTLDSANGVGAQRVVGFCCSDQMRDGYRVCFKADRHLCILENIMNIIVF